MHYICVYLHRKSFREPGSELEIITAGGNDQLAPIPSYSSTNPDLSSTSWLINELDDFQHLYLYHTRRIHLTRSRIRPFPTRTRFGNSVHRGGRIVDSWVLAVPQASDCEALHDGGDFRFLGKNVTPTCPSQFT